MTESRSSIDTPFLRHGRPEGVGEGKKPESYEVFNAWLTGDDIGIEEKDTAERIQAALDSGALDPKSFNAIVTSPFKRTRQTADMIQKMANNNATIYENPLFREVRVPSISREVYDACEDIHDLRKHYLAPFLEGKAVAEETPLQAYRRAQEALVFLHGVCVLTKEKPVLVSHNTFGRFIQLAINHQGETLSDAETAEMIKKEFMSTKSAAFLEGPVFQTTSEGETVLV